MSTSFDRERLECLLKCRFCEQLNLPQGPKHSEQAKIKLELSDLDQRLERIKDSIEQGVPVGLVKDRLEKIQASRSALKGSLRELQREQKPSIDLAKVQQQVEKLIGEFETAFDSASVSRQKELIRAFVGRIEIDQKARTATCYVNKLPSVVKVSVCRRPDSNRHGVATGGF